MNKEKQLTELRKKALADENLPLKKGATNLVFGVGNPEAKMIFIGEGPGYWEDVKAEPFVGPAGKLLDRLLNLIGIKRSEVFITNVVMHRPPENRDPSPEEIAAYQPYLDGVIEIISPSLVVTLGRFSMAKFLPTAVISKVHGQMFPIDWHGQSFGVVPMYHPAAALRSNDIMVKIREDFLKLPEFLKAAKNKIEMVKKEENSALPEEEQMSLF